MKDGLIKQLKKGKQTLEHSRYYDDFGLLRDAFQMIKPADEELKKKGYTTMKKPFWGILKVTNFNPEDPIKTYTDYTEEDYEEMFERNKF